MKLLIADIVLLTIAASLPLSDLAPDFLNNADESTEIVDAIVVRIFDDGGVKLDVRDVFKAEFIPKSIRPRQDQELDKVFEVDGRYLIFVYDHNYVQDHSIFAIEERDDRVFCRCGKDGEWIDTSALHGLVVGDTRFD